MYRVAQGVELHFSLHKRKYNIWFEINIATFREIPAALKSRAHYMIDRLSNHLIHHSINTSNMTSTDKALRALQRRPTTGVVKGDACHSRRRAQPRPRPRAK